MRNYAGTRKGICSYSLVYNFLIQLLRLQGSVCLVHFSNAFWHGNDAFPKVSSQNEIVPLLVILSHIANRQGVKMFSLLPLFSLLSKYFTCVALVSFMQHSCRSCCTRVALVSLVSRSCRSCLALVLQNRLDEKLYKSYYHKENKRKLFCNSTRQFLL